MALTSTAIQLIDETCQFNGAVGKYMSKLHLQGFDYHLIAVFGSQSTGKSTLLNGLFGTSFDVMDETVRKQTTKGIWLAKAQKSNTLVLDVEGTDGRERADDQDFERRSALFSLAISEIIIVNLWEHQVGLYQGANMALLKTVFEVNLQLFRQNEKSLLLFVIRDYLGSTPLTALAETLKADLMRIWSTISKPEGLEDCTLEDYFDLQFKALPHKILQSENFAQIVAELAQEIGDGNLFKPAYRKSVPADGIAMYAESCWDQIVANKDLDLPTQQVLLAQYRCDEIASEVEKTFDALLTPLETIARSNNLLTSLGSDLNRGRAQVLVNFDAEASRYHRDTYLKRRQNLISKIDSRMYVLFIDQVGLLHRKSIHSFTNAVAVQFVNDYSFAQILSTERTEVEESFKIHVHSILVNDAGWNYDEELQALQTDLEAESQKFRTQEAKKIASQLQDLLAEQLEAPTHDIFRKAPLTLWDDIADLYDTALKDLKISFAMQCKEIGAKDVALDDSSTLRRLVEANLTDSNLLLLLRDSFEDKFRFDEHGVPRIWKPSDDIEKLYRDARDEALSRLELFTNSPYVTVPAQRKKDVEARFRKASDSMYIESKRSVMSSVTQIPLFMYVLLVILGWNEFTSVLRNPFLFSLALIAGALGYVIWSTNMAGPVVQMGNAALQQGLELGKGKLRELLTDERPPSRPPSREAPGIATNI